MKIIKLNDSFYFNIDEIFILKKDIIDNPKLKEWIDECNAIIEEVKNINDDKLPEISLDYNTIFSPSIKYTDIDDLELEKLKREYSNKFIEEFVIPRIGNTPEEKVTKYELMFKNGHKIDLDEGLYYVIKKELDKIIEN